MLMWIVFLKIARDLYGVMYLSRMVHHKIHTLKTKGSKLLIT